MNTAPTLLQTFAAMPDPRIDRQKKHQLLDIIVIAICAVLSGADAWTDVEDFGRVKEAWLRTFLALPNGIPSHDTFGRVFALLDARAFQARFAVWAGQVARLKLGEVVAVDGKTLRRSHDHYKEKDAIAMVSAWASEARLVLGQHSVEAGTNEVASVPLLLQTLMLRGCIVTMDAANCQTQNARIVIEQGGDYVFALKANQATLHEEVRQVFEETPAEEQARIKQEVFQTHQKSHGRIETRRYTLLTDPEYIAYLNRDGRWWHLGSVGRVERTRSVAGKTEREVHYFVSSLAFGVKLFAKAVRAHWSIENGLHWVLDIAFREDDSRVREGQAAENFAVLRHIAVNLIKQDKTFKVGVKGKRLVAGWDNDYMLRLLSAAAN